MGLVANEKDHQEEKSMNILVTGGAGFIGFHVARALVERGDTVIIVDDLNSYYSPRLKQDRLAQLQGKVVFYGIPLWDLASLKEVFAQHRLDKICHLGAQAGVRHSIQNPFLYNKSNVLGTLNILELMKEFNLKDIVFASSSSVYGGNEKVPFSIEDRVDRPISLYAATKRTNELYAYVYHHLYGFNCFGLRFFTVYGPWGRPDMALFKFVKALLNDQPIDVYNRGEMRRSFTHVKDIVRGVLAALDAVEGYELLNLGNPDSVDLLSFIRCIEKVLGKTSIKNMLPLQQGDVPATVADIEKTKTILGWEPEVSLEEGVAEFVSWYKEYYGA